MRNNRTAISLSTDGKLVAGVRPIGLATKNSCRTPAAGTTQAPWRAAYPCPRSMITILKRRRTGVLRLPDGYLVPAAHQRPSSRNALSVATWLGQHIDMCFARGGPPKFSTCAALRVHARRLGLRDAVAHASPHRRRVCHKHLLGLLTRPRPNNPGMEQPPRLLLNAAVSLSKDSGRPATVPWWRETAEIRWNGFASRRVAWYDGPGRLRLENSTVSS
jgi:hypothetical protein